MLRIEFFSVVEKKPTRKRQHSESLEDVLLQMSKDVRYPSPTDDSSPDGQPSRRGYETSPDVSNDDAFFLCPSCKTYQPIEFIAEHENCRPQEPRISGGSILSRRPLIGTSTSIPTGPPRYGGTPSAAGPDPTTMANRGRSSPAGQPPLKRRRVQASIHFLHPSYSHRRCH
jgi:hypothetical protein